MLVMTVHGRTDLGLPFLTGFFAGLAQTIGDFGLVYQSLPCLHSGSNPAAGLLYQSLPPRLGTRYGLTYSLRWPASGIMVHSYKGR